MLFLHILFNIYNFNEITTLIFNTNILYIALRKKNFEIFKLLLEKDSIDINFINILENIISYNLSQ